MSRKLSCLRVPSWASCEGRSRADSYQDESSSPWTEHQVDKYTAAIELSNRCREFYQARLEAAESIKGKWRENTSRRRDSDGEAVQSECDVSFSSISSSGSSLSLEDSNTIPDRTESDSGQKSRLDDAMDKLRTEMMSLMDQDLSLMKQLLMLNETIEELKWQRQNCSYNTSWTSFSASQNLDNSCLSVSDSQLPTCQYDPRNNRETQSSNFLVHRPGQATVVNISDQAQLPRNANLENLSSDRTRLETTTHTLTMASSISPSKPRSSIFSEGELSNHQLSGNSCSSSSSEYCSIKIHHQRGENSFDSGIHDVHSVDEFSWKS